MLKPVGNIRIWLQSNKHNIVIVVFWTIILAGTAYAAWSALQSSDQVAKIVVAIIGAAALFLGSILTHFYCSV